MIYLLKAVDTYRVPSVADVEALHDQLLSDPTFDLTEFSYKTRYIKEKGEIVEEYQVVTAKKIFTQEKEPDRTVTVNYEVE
jgi:hypothetical protein